MNIINSIRKWVRGMFPIHTVEQVYKVDAAVSASMMRCISHWMQMYSGKASWTDSDEVISLRLEQSIVREFANITLNEMTVSVTDKRLDDIFQKTIRSLDINLQKGLAAGAFIVKPLGIGSSDVQYIPQGAFIPLAYNIKGRLTDVIFPDIKRVSDSEYYIRLERHTIDARGLTITNRAFRSNSPDTLGREISLHSVADWENIKEAESYPLMTRPAFGYYVNPIDNTIDGSPAGVSIFESAVELIRYADIQFGRLDWEYEASEKIIHVDEAALCPVQTIKGMELELPKLKKRLYKGLNLSCGASGAELFKEYSPQIRDNNFITGLDTYKREIEFCVGLSYGDISNPQSVDKTATEVRAAKQRKYNTVTAIQKNLKTCLDDLVYALAFWNGMTQSGYEFVCDFKDSILTDEETERKQDIQDLQLGILRPEEYRAKWYGESLDEALKNLPETAQVIE